MNLIDIYRPCYKCTFSSCNFVKKSGLATEKYGVFWKLLRVLKMERYISTERKIADLSNGQILYACIPTFAGKKWSIVVINVFYGFVWFLMRQKDNLENFQEWNYLLYVDYLGGRYPLLQLRHKPVNRRGAWPFTITACDFFWQTSVIP